MSLENLRTEMANNGYQFSSNFTTGKIERFGINKPNDKKGWYLLFDNGGFMFAEYGDWVSGNKHQWKSTGESITKEDNTKIKQAQEQYKQERKKEQELAKIKAKEIYSNAQETTIFNEYLKNKGFDKYQDLQHPARQGSKGELIIPIMDIKGDITSLQTIYPNGDKRLFSGGVKKGNFCLLGSFASITKEIYICEGYATALSVYLAFDCLRAVVFAVDNGNLEPVIHNIKNNYKDKTIINCADNDHTKDKNAGIIKAKELKQKYNIPFVYPDFIKGSDFDDLRQEKDLKEVKSKIESVVIDDVLDKKDISLIDKILEKIELTKSTNETAFATLPNGLTAKVGSSIFKDWVGFEYNNLTGKYIKESQLKDIVHNIKGKTMFSQTTSKDIFKRVGYSSDNQNIYIDMANSDFNVIKVNANGWEVVKSKTTGIKFETTNNMQPLPHPIKGRDVGKLWQFTNIKDVNQQKLLLAWLVNCFIPFSGYPVLVLTGGEGTAKSTTQSNLRDLIDPSTGNLRMKGSGSDFLPIQAINNYMVSLENLGSGKNNLTPTEQDQLCTIATGGSLSNRKKYSDDEESMQVVKNPIMLNGITGFISQQDLLSRCVVLGLSKIKDSERKTDRDIEAKFIEAKPEIFGALLDIVAKVINLLPSIQADNLPRMAEFGKIGVALESVMGWKSGEFLQTYRDFQNEVAMETLESEPVIIALISYLKENKCKFNNDKYIGYWHDLLKDLKQIDFKKGVSLDRLTPKGLSNKLRKNATALEKIGITCNFDLPRSNQGKKIEITLETIKE
jgi:phage/plasmid primase-like uncharacterized protein